ncbi:CIA30 family protein [Psychroflexus sp. CAK57W]|uniref:CIA30 family protein n=1 Tax=Psychroflexus curvus TaxID=2873595 RepID=UPI001CCE31E8|nr:CIA30 family protein [Psychroflexus curvus]MBZ9786985.1 CIA30 family protein [Psychroflexus curvus]
MAQQHIIYDFEPKENITDWQIVNDGVMGGLSQSSMRLSDAGNAIFSGQISLKNNGGFASVRHETIIRDVQDFTYVNLRVKGTPSIYQFRIKKSGEEEAHSYVHEFKVTSEWNTVQLKLSSFSPRYRGRNLNLPDFNADAIREVAFLIGNKKEEEFHLEVDKIYLTK